MKYILMMQIAVEAETAVEAVANHAKGEIISLKVDKRHGPVQNDQRPATSATPLMRRPQPRQA